MEPTSHSERIIAEARSWIGTPYHHGQGVKGQGVDCAWFLIRVYGAVGLAPADFDPGTYSRNWFLHRNDGRYERWLEQFAARIEGDPQPGDVALFRVARAAAHAAIVVTWPTVIHAFPRGGVREVDAMGRDLAGRYVCAWRARAA